MATIKSIEEKAKAYDGLIERLKDLKFAYRFSPLSDTIEEKFPELRESEGERIRKALIRYFTLSDEHAYNEAYGVSYRDIVAWLEKQGKKTKPIEGFNTEFERQVSCLIASAMNRDYEYTKDFVKWTSDALLNYAKLEIEKNSMGISEATKKKLEDNLNKALEKETPESWNKFLDEQGEQKPADTVEPKFHEGDWITNGDYTWKIVVVKSLDYILQSQGGNIVEDTISHVDGQFHSFTIQDAKDGDVIFYDDGWTCIFKNIHGIWYSSYCFITADGEFHTGYEQHAVDAKLNGNANPATKEQRDLLFQKMKEAGFEWDAEKKELKNIEQKPAEWSEEDEKMIRGLIVICDEWTTRHSFYPIENCEIEKLKNWVYSLKERVLPQPKQEWSKDVENNILFLTSIIEECFKDKEKITLCSDTVCANFTKKDVIDRLKSLKPQKQWKQENTGDLTDFENAMMHIARSFFGENAGLNPNDTNAIKEQANILLGLVPRQEWSEEDEEILNTIINHFKIDIECTDEDDIIKWLKSLKERYTWKPSDEQMLAINTSINIVGKDTINGKYLIELAEQLKKLKEE